MNIKKEHITLKEIELPLGELGISEADWQATPASAQKVLIDIHQRLLKLKKNSRKPLKKFANLKPEVIHNEAVTASKYDFTKLADIYNQTRIDYIIPMPMNANKMRDYYLSYDIDLDSSIVAIDPNDGGTNGICMLGVRDDRTWITRLGVIPHRRGRKIGQFLMLSAIEKAIAMGKKYMQLEVIKGNEPAHRMFKKFGFEETRELLVIRRPPGKVNPNLVPQMKVYEIPDENVFDYLEYRETNAAWTEETSSLQNSGNMHGLLVSLTNGETGWIVFQENMFQLSHFVFSPDSSTTMMSALLSAVHLKYPQKDTSIENVPADHPTWPIFQNFSYMESFSRIEMYLSLE